MKKFLLVVIALAFSASLALANVGLYVDSAPNAYGSPAYEPWKADAFAKAAVGTFTNMANGINAANVDTTNYEIEDEVVYSFGDLGKRMHFVYWVPDQTVAELTGNFKLAMYYTWEGVKYDFYKDYYGTTLLEPKSWVNYDADGDGDTDGVIGTAGFAWWGAYGVNTQAALDADLDAWRQATETLTLKIYMNGIEANSLTCYRDGIVVPAPGALLLGALGTSLVGWIRRRA